ncbi:cwf19 cell cycle control protein [Holotrichia oblita]|uniref:Cwf19 cell cycle control protein n=1 Tax=Holotrichia oblita TaxID=644536 RepID=A0ACB9TQZ5_HOLOL|nr:cwf19 cell cycle control protein [Holotrichia oblita]
MEEKIKILLCGDVEGKFNALFNRVENIVKKSGHFDLVLCIGNFFGVNNKEFEPYKRGIKKVPVTTYILGPNNEDTTAMFQEDSEICPNVYYIGKRGLYVTTNGLKIAYISGTYNNDKSRKDYQYSFEDALFLRDVCIKGSDNFRGVDILLTSQWPTNIIPKDKLKAPLMHAADIVSWLAVQLKPRYHVSGLEGIHFERQPYRITSSDTPIQAVTRFIALARVANPQKEKWIYAVNLTPIDKMKMSDILLKTTDETDCPYDVAELSNTVIPQNQKKRSTETSQFFYDMNAPSDERHYKKSKRAKVEFDQNKCWFCLASSSVEKHLIIIYIVFVLGGIVDEHFLICPVQHHQSSIHLPDEVLDEIEQFKEAITQFYSRNETVPVFFERNYKTSHMQLQCIPIPTAAQQDLEDIFQDEAECQNIKLNNLDPTSRLNQVVESNKPYFFLQLPNGKKFYTRIDGPKGFPINFGRDVLAMGPILNKPDRIEWKDCVLKREEEEVLVKRIRMDFEPYAIND